MALVTMMAMERREIMMTLVATVYRMLALVTMMAMARKDFGVSESGICEIVSVLGTLARRERP